MKYNSKLRLQRFTTPHGVELHERRTKPLRVIAKISHTDGLHPVGAVSIGYVSRPHSRNLDGNDSAVFPCTKQGQNPADGPDEARLGLLPVHALREAEVGDYLRQNLR